MKNISMVRDSGRKFSKYQILSKVKINSEISIPKKPILRMGKSNQNLRKIVGNYIPKIRQIQRIREEIDLNQRDSREMLSR
jgi:hypothetical protein